MKNPNQRLLYLLPLLLTVALIVFGEALGDLWKEDVKAVFQQNKWLLLALVGFLWERQQRSEKTALRLALYFEGKIPLRVVTFMDRMSEQLIFEDNRRSNKKGKKMRGATWRFRHKILQDYFAT